MEFINKCNQVLFSPHYLRFENLRWNVRLTKYHKYDYKNFSIIKSDIRDLLIDEQQEKCCYCLKVLEKNSSTTLEHIYPRNPISGTIFTSYAITCIDFRTFDYSIQNIPNARLDNLPHDLSYYNLLACCEKCNKERGNKNILPFIFDSAVKTKFLYNDQGNIFSHQYLNEIVSIGLADDYYRKNRKIWRIMKNSFGHLPVDLKTEIRTIASMLYLTDPDPYYLTVVNNDDIVNDTMKYKYFFDN